MLIKSLRGLFLTGILTSFSMMLWAQAPFTGTSQFRKFSVGINAGLMRPAVVTGGSNDFTNPQFTFGYGANLKYQFTHVLGVQVDFIKGTLKGNNDKDLSSGVPPTGRPNESFETDILYGFSVNPVATLGNINWLSKKNAVVPYLTAGFGFMKYKPTIVPTGTSTPQPYRGGETLSQLYIPVGAGLKVKLSERINLDLGYRAHFVDNDDLDGTYISPGQHHDKFSYGFAGLEISLGKKEKKQLMYNNPVAQLNNILTSKLDSMQMAVDSLTAGMVDSDGDGVPDRIDKCPDTPEGVKVDSHGCPMDTDGDGVPDYLDKELITPTECQPVDADGVGKCPEPECCKAMAAVCNIGELPSITFKGRSATLATEQQAMLANVASRMKNNPTCSITIVGYPQASKSSQAVSNQRLNAVKNYLVEKEGISSDRVMTTSEVGGGDANVVDIRSN